MRITFDTVQKESVWPQQLFSPQLKNLHPGAQKCGFNSQMKENQPQWTNQ